MYIFAVILYSFLKSICYNIISSKEKRKKHLGGRKMDIKFNILTGDVIMNSDSHIIISNWFNLLKC